MFLTEALDPIGFFWLVGMVAAVAWLFLDFRSGAIFWLSMSLFLLVPAFALGFWLSWGLGGFIVHLAAIIATMKGLEALKANFWKPLKWRS